MRRIASKRTYPESLRWLVAIVCILHWEPVPWAAVAQTVPCVCEGQRSVLWAFNRATGGTRWEVPWDPSAPVCSWYGVTCASTGDVTKLALPENRLSGALPASLGDLVGVEEFNVHGNTLNGTLPESLKQWTLLKVFDVSDNALGGTLPPQYADWTLIERFLTYDNKLNGTIPESYGRRWTGVTAFEVHHNQLSGIFHEHWSSWRALTRLQMDRNNFTGTLPEAYSQLVHMQHFTLSTNMLHGTLPASYSNWTDLRRFIVRRNAFSGGLPASYAAWTNLEEFAANDNALSGELPKVYGLAWPNLHLFAADKNQFGGTLPESFSEWRNLTSFDISVNSIGGTLPAAYTSWKFLTKFVVHSNRFVGSLPSAYRTWSSVMYFSVARNQLTGTLPPEYWQWSSIKTLAAFRNQLNGTLPAVWGYMSKLTDLYLHDNALEGSLPPEYFSLGSLGFLWLAQNKLSGTLPESWSNLRLFSPDLPALGLVLQGNAFTGSIPPSWGQMVVQPTTLISLCDTTLCGAFPAELQQKLMFLVCLNNLDLDIEDWAVLQAALDLVPFATPLGDCAVPLTTTAAPLPAPTNASIPRSPALTGLHTYVVVAPFGGLLVGSVVAGPLSLGTLRAYATLQLAARCAATDSGGTPDAEPSIEGPLWMAGIVVGACVAVYGAAAASTYCRGRAGSATTTQRRHAVVAPHPLNAALASWRLPGRLGPLIGALATLLLETCVPLLASDDGSTTAVGSIGLCIACVLLAWPCAYVTVWFGGVFKCNGAALRSTESATAAPHHGSAGSMASASWRRRPHVACAMWVSSAVGVVFPSIDGSWSAVPSLRRPQFVAAYGVLFEDCVGERHWYFAMECGFAVVASVLAGVAATSAATACEALRYAMGAVNLAAYLGFLLLRVFMDRRVALTAAALGGLTCLGSVLLLADCPDCSDAAEIVMEMQLWLTIALCALDAWRAFGVRWLLALRRAWWPWPHKRHDDVDHAPSKLRAAERRPRRAAGGDANPIAVATTADTTTDGHVRGAVWRHGARHGQSHPCAADRLREPPMRLMSVQEWQHRALAALVDMICDGRDAR